MDPATVAQLAKIAFDRVKDEESRKKTLMLILIPIIALLMIISCAAYILMNPLDFLLEKFGLKEDVVSEIQFKYGDISDTSGGAEEEIEYDEIEYDDVIMTSGETKVIYYNQADPAWGSMLYGNLRPISATGCGPTSMAIVISTLKEKIIPPEACKWSAKNGYLVEGTTNGKPYAMSSHALIPNMAKAFGLKCQGVGKGSDTEEKIVKALSNGKLVVAIMGPGHFTTGGHFMVLRGVTKKGKILIADCGSNSRYGDKL